MRPIVLTFLLLLHASFQITPVCYNCHCSLYELDRRISCKTGIFNRTNYFTVWTRAVHVGPGSDVVLAAEVKEPTGEYCWCTDARLEWNGLFQNSSGRLLTTHMTEVTGVESGHFWAVLAIGEDFYFSDTILLNITVPDVEPTLPPLDIDPKMSALIVGVLFVVIMVCGIGIYCCKMHKRAKMLKKRFRISASESKIPLTSWDLQAPSEVIVEEEPLTSSIAPHPASDLEEEGSVSSREAKEKSTSLSSQDEGDNTVNSKTQVVISDNAPVNFAYHVPIKDDRFRTDKSWYRSLNTEVVSESLLSDKKRIQKKEEKKRRKQLKNDRRLSNGGAAGYSKTDIEKMERVYKAYQNLSRDFKYGRSLPTPQPAGARPTVMQVFPTRHATLAGTGGGATIHTTHPVVPRPTASSLFADPDETRGSRVQFTTAGKHRRRASVDLAVERPNITPKKSSLKTISKYDNHFVETDSGAKDSPAANLVSSDSSGSSGSSSGGGGTDLHGESAGPRLPVLDLTPATPITASPATTDQATTPAMTEQTSSPSAAASSRFTVKRVDSDDKTIGQPVSNANDPRDLWDFGKNDASLQAASASKKMDLLTVPDPLGLAAAGFVVDTGGYWST